MAEPPIIKIKKDYEPPPNITAEVPPEQTIREMAPQDEPNTSTNTEVTGTNTSSEVDTGYTLSPVITVTKKETTLTKGDLKLQKVTVSEDISVDEMETDDSLNYIEAQTTITQTVKSEEVTEGTSDKDERRPEEKKSRIPKLKFRQTVEKVKRERKEQKTKDQNQNTPRRSSIPKLKDAKLVKRQSSINNEPKQEVKPVDIEAQIMDEFDKIYEEIVDDPQKDIDEKVLAVKIDDPEKVETKFEEIIHAYDSNDDSYFSASGKIKLSKIPWRRKDEGRSASAASRMKRSHSETDSKLKDGGFKVSATTITTKRFSRGNSADLSNTQKVDVVEFKNGNDQKIVKETIVTETIEGTVTKNVTSRGIKREISLDDDDSKITKKIEKSKDGTEETVKIEEFEGGRKITKETITKQNIKTGIPVKHEKISRSISKELNKRPPSLDDRDFVNREVVKHETHKNGGSRTIIKETVVKETPIKSEKVSRGISRTFSRDGKSVTVTAKAKEINIENNNNLDKDKVQSNKDTKDEKSDSKAEDVKSEKTTKESNKKPIPLKTTHSYSKGHIQTVEISKTIEWKPADEIRLPKKYGRSISENKKEVSEQKFAPTVIKNEAVIETKLVKEYIPVVEEFKLTPSHEMIDRKSQQSEDITESLDVSKDSAEITKSREAPRIDTNSNNSTNAHVTAKVNKQVEPVIVKTPIWKETADTKLPEKKKDSNTPPTTILKGNVSRLISQISVSESRDVKKEIDIKEDLPKKKSVLSKIAMFEGKDPDEFKIKVKKCVIDKKPSSNSKENVAEVSKIVDQEIKDDINKVEINGAYKVTREINDEPVIVDQIWKVQDQITETISVIHHVDDVKILPTPIESSVTESNHETGEILFNKIEVNANIIRVEHAAILPGKIDSIATQNQVEPIEFLPGELDTDHNNSNEIKTPNNKVPEKIQLDKAKRLPEKSDSTPNEEQNNYPAHIAQDTNKEKQTDKKPRVGKLDLSIWQKQVEDNKKSVGTGKTTKDQAHLETQKILPATVVFEKDFNEVEVPKILPGKIAIKSEENIPTIIPGRINITREISSIEEPKSAVGSNERQLEVPIELPETPLTRSFRKDYETQRSHIDVPVIYGGKIEFTTKVDNVKMPVILPEIINFKVDEATQNQTLPAQAEISINQPENISTQVSQNNGFNNQLDKQSYNNVDETETAKILPEQIHFKHDESKVEITKPLPIVIDLNPENNNNLEATSKNETTVPDRLHNKIIDDIDTDREVPSDPELVDSEPEIKETKEPIMSKLKNKIYFIANKSKHKNISLEVSTAPKDTNENDSYSSSIKVENNDSDFSSMEYSANDYRDSGAKSDIEFYKTEDNTREDIKRAKSLAELDLGDVVKGQVRRMVYRIKSVDFEKAETPRARKISVKEMPRKSSVLEKIALFEGKAASTKWEKIERPDRFETTSSRFETTSARFETRTSRIETRHFETTTAMPVKVQTSGASSEEVYLQKVEDLTTAKLRYGKSNMLYLQLANGEQMPAIALGTALMDVNLAPNIVAAAIDLGFRAIDTAFIYGNEQAVGEGIRMKINDGTVKREDLFIMSKLWSTYHRQDLVESACRASLKALGLDYFDLYMIHNPMSLKEGGDPIPTIASVLQYSEHDYLEAWFGMEKLVSLGLVKNLGVSNFNSRQIQRILDKGKIKPVVNQVECHPYLSQQRLQNFCTERNITLSCYGVLGSKGTPLAFKNTTEACIDDPMIKVMASGLDKTPAQLLVRYQIQSGRNAVVKASSAAHLWDILQALTFTLEQHEIDAIHALNRGRRTFTFKGMGDTHPNYPFTEPF